MREIPADADPSPRPAARCGLALALLVLCASLGAAIPTTAQTVDFAFHWAPSATLDDDGLPLADAVGYEVWLKRGSELAEKIATVENDTTYVLAAEAGVVQRIRVCGYDARGRQSAFSEWSEPIYFTDYRSPVEVPLTPQLRPNYPNPFNPQTNIVYGVPDNLPQGTVVHLEILNLRGQRVRAFAIEAQPGWHEIMWDGTDASGRTLPTGPYFSRYLCANQIITRKMTLLK